MLFWVLGCESLSRDKIITKKILIRKIKQESRELTEKFLFPLFCLFGVVNKNFLKENVLH